MSKSLATTVMMATTLSLAGLVHAQNAQPLVDGLKAPLKVLALENGTVLVAEAGAGANQGRISFIDQQRRRATLIDQLPGATFYNGSASGPAGLVLQGKRLYILIGSGDQVLAGQAPGSEVPNPTPSSPLLSSLLAAEFDDSGDGIAGDFSLPRVEHDRVAQGEVVTLFNARGQACRLWRVADFPDYLPEPRPGAPANVRQSNPFGMVGTSARIDVIDASRNLLWRVTPGTGEVAVTATFEQVVNSAPTGAPRVDAVPVHRPGVA